MKHLFISWLGLALTLFSSIGYAEFSCRVEVSYKWKKAGAEALEEVRISGVEAKGIDENSAKSAVGQVLGREKARAHERCRAQHENVAQCVASKFEASKSTIQTVSFTARKAIEDAITSDCKAVQGICQGVAASEPVCVELAQAVGTEGEKDGKEKEAGKDKKK